MNKKQQGFFANIKNELIVSCQAQKGEPLHSSYIMGRMAVAARDGGAKGIRTDSVADIREIKRQVEMPIIGIIKKDYDNSDVFITPTFAEIDQLYNEGIDMIALDATDRIRPNGETILEHFPKVRKEYPDQLFMADCSTYEEAVEAERLGFDCVGTTLRGYTSKTKNVEIPDLDFIEKLVAKLNIPIIAEGGIYTPKLLKEVFDKGVHAAVVGSAITRPKEITLRFTEAIK